MRRRAKRTRRRLHQIRVNGLLSFLLRTALTPRRPALYSARLDRMNLRLRTQFTRAALFALCLFPALALAGGWDDILKPNFKRVYNPEKQFEGKPFALEKEFTIKSFPAEKTVKPTPFPIQTFRGSKPASAESKTFTPKESSPLEKSYRVGNWQNSERPFRTNEVAQKESNLSSKASPLAGKTVPQPEPSDLSKPAPDASKSVPQPRVMDEETARKLIEKLYGPMGGRGQQ
jgi:hypothetical protein